MTDTIHDQRHAYLIIAHNNFYILEKLLLLLDDSRNDIFLHIDKKVHNFNFSYYKGICKCARVIYPTKRIDVRWGTQSQVITELLLYEFAYAHGPYRYYHLLSGVDLPLKSQSEIHHFFSDKKCEFLQFKRKLNAYDIMRVSRYHFFSGKNSLLSRINSISDRCQDALNVNRVRWLSVPVQRGHNWCDLTQLGVAKLLQKKDEIMRLTRYSLCADEVYKQTFLSEDGLSICDDDLRLVDWSRSVNGNNPHIFTLEDWDMLTQSDKLFARKFDTNIDQVIVDKIFEYVKSKH